MLSFTFILINKGCGNDFADFAHSLASSLSTSHGCSDWRMVLVDLRNHGRSTDIKGLSPPHDTINAAKDIANLVKSLEWAWPDVVIGHSLGGKVALQYALSCAQGDYGDSAQLPKQVWVLDVVPGKIPTTSHYAEIEKALYKLKTVPSPIHSKEWLVDHLINLGFSKFLSEWISSGLKRSGDHETFYFNIDGVIEMFNSAQVRLGRRTNTFIYQIGQIMLSMMKTSLSRDMDYWALLEHPPKGTEIAIVRTESKLKWEPDLVESLDSLAKRETDESTGKVSVHVVANSGHYIHKDQPQTLLQIMTPKISSLA